MEDGLIQVPFSRGLFQDHQEALLSLEGQGPKGQGPCPGLGEEALPGKPQGVDQKPPVQEGEEAFPYPQALPQEPPRRGVVEHHLALGVGQDHPLGQVADEGGKHAPLPLQEGLGLGHPGGHLLFQGGLFLRQALDEAGQGLKLQGAP